MFTKTRYKYAFMFGRLEHNLSRLLFVELLITYAAFRLGHADTLNYLLPVAIAIWLGYWGSHRFEKALHPDH